MPIREIAARPLSIAFGRFRSTAAMWKFCAAEPSGLQMKIAHDRGACRDSYAWRIIRCASAAGRQSRHRRQDRRHSVVQCYGGRISRSRAKDRCRRFHVGPTSADPALQVRAIEDLIAQGVKVVGDVPNDAEVLEPVLQKVKDAGIIVTRMNRPARRAPTPNQQGYCRRSRGDGPVKPPKAMAAELPSIWL